METKWKIIHWLIIINFVVEIIYCAYQVFFVLIPEGQMAGPLIGTSLDLIRNDYELFEARRLYSFENWVAITGLSIYLAIVYRDKLNFNNKNESNI